MLKIFTDSRCLGHRAPVGYPESPARLQGILRHLSEQGFVVEDTQPTSPGAARDPLPAIESVHAPDYVDRFRRAVARGDGLLDSADNPLSPGTWDAALGAASAALAAADWVMDGAALAAADWVMDGTKRYVTGRHGFVAVRPPGHHAEIDRAMGFCFFDTVAVAAQHLLTDHDLRKVAIVDFDVHHGNGTQHLFEERADVFVVNLHQFPFYPGTGGGDESGRGTGAGATLNVPLSMGSGDEVYSRAIRQQVLPALRRFAPEVLLLSAGFDAWDQDPLGGMEVSLEGYRHWGELLGALALEVCEGRCLSLLEGGYDVDNLPRLVEAYLQGVDAALQGERPCRPQGEKSQESS